MESALVDCTVPCQFRIRDFAGIDTDGIVFASCAIAAVAPSRFIPIDADKFFESSVPKSRPFGDEAVTLPCV